ncbi:MAG: SMP-30/gluconolactonase/LRE family protein [Fimbriiglobus sp.]
MLRLVLCSLLLVPMMALAQEAPPKGELLKFTFNNSKIFPSTTRDVSVYIPAQYDGKTPACVHVNQDGVQFNAVKVFDELIAKKEIPVLIGVFVMHGKVNPADPEKALPRFNRSYEYDGLGDNYARFMLEEILPFVESKTATDGRKIVLSKSGNDRSIGGTSSGAICAFTAAWERPDAFTRVFSGIGTYVGLRGGHNYATLIRKYEPKPIRIFMEDGTKDLNIYGGDWWIANQAMERSLKFAGYEVESRWSEEGHNNKHATQLFPEAMKYLWKGWPEPVKTGVSNNDYLKDILIPGEGWKVVGEGYQFTEGPVVNAKGEVFFCDVPKSKIYKLDAAGKPVEWCGDSKRASGLSFGPDGTLYGAHGGGLLKFSATGEATSVVTGFGGNDLVALHNGNIYVSNPNANPQDRSRIQLIKNGKAEVVDTGLAFANGLCTSPDQTLLYVADSRTHWVYSYQILADGKLGAKQKYFHLHVPDTADEASADGLRTDREGRVWITTRIGLQVADQPGRVHAIIPTPNGKASNITFGGPNFDTIYVTANDKVFSRKVKAKGTNNFEAPIKPKAPGL